MSDSRLTLHELEAVLAVARRASFRRAAIDLNVSTTALSSTIAKLEATLQTRLFNRTTRSVSLTEAGSSYLEQVEPALQALRGALETVRSHNAEPAGVIRINAFASAARTALLPLVLEFADRYPRVQIDLVTEERLVDVVAEGFDLGVRASNLIPNDMIAIPLGQTQRYAVVGTPLYFSKHGEPQNPADLMRHECLRIRLPNGAIYPWYFEQAGEVLRLDVEGRFTVDEPSVAKAIVQANVALGLFLEQEVQAEVDAGDLQRVLQDWTPPRDEMCLYYPNRRNPSAALKAFTDLARESLQRRKNPA